MQQNLKPMALSVWSPSSVLPDIGSSVILAVAVTTGYVAAALWF
jgi:hypothetical protein